METKQTLTKDDYLDFIKQFAAPRRVPKKFTATTHKLSLELEELSFGNCL